MINDMQLEVKNVLSGMLLEFNLNILNTRLGRYYFLVKLNILFCGMMVVFLMLNIGAVKW